MQEFDSVKIKNPTSEDFTWKWNGEPYTVPAGEEKSLAGTVALHLAKHLSSKMLHDEFPWDKRKSRTQQEIEKEAVQFSNLTINDNPKRRIALYKILGDPILVQDCIASYPFKGFIGEMDDYKKFVETHGGTLEKPVEKKMTIEELAEQVRKLNEKFQGKEGKKV